MKINTQHGLGSKLKKKTKMIGTILKKVSTMILSSKRKSMKHKKQKIWSPKSNIKSWALKPNKISMPKDEIKNIQNGRKINLLAQVFTESQLPTVKKMINPKTESF